VSTSYPGTLLKVLQQAFTQTRVRQGLPEVEMLDYQITRMRWQDDSGGACPSGRPYLSVSIRREWKETPGKRERRVRGQDLRFDSILWLYSAIL
jgi:hypothetical protein